MADTPSEPQTGGGARTRTRRRTSRATAAKPRRINLALQGGGAHGAFTWGVLDRILADGRLEIEGISGTSAGAMNAAVMADGMVEGGPEVARRKLRGFWHAVSHTAMASPIQRSILSKWMGDWSLDWSLGYLTFDLLSRSISPYEFNPLNFNPLRTILQATVDFDRVRACETPQVFVTATNVHTGKPRVFEHQEISADAVLASACLPFVFQAVEIDGEAYWDGGYIGNPALWPLIYHCQTRDVMLVQINPLRRAGVPRNARDIMDRVNEITFNNSLLREMRAIAFVSRLIDDGHLDEARYRKLLLHVVEAEREMNPLGASSKLNAEWAFLTHLHDIGWRAAESWLDAHVDAVGERSTVDIEEIYL